MSTGNEKLITLVLQALAKGELTDDDRFNFSRDHRRYKNHELTFRELMDTIRQPKGNLKTAIINYYAGSVYRRKFK